MNRRDWIQRVGAILGAGIFLGATRKSRAETRDPITKLTLKETLANGLRTSRPQDVRFLTRISRLVESGTLPESLVMATFNWARKQPDKRFQYFQEALRAQAAKRGIAL